MSRFTLYIEEPLLTGITFDELLKEQNAERMLFANAEHSGCEGVYVEVAKWNDAARQWQAYAFLKFEDANDPEAQKLVDQLNEPLGERPSFIHNLPKYSRRKK